MKKAFFLILISVFFLASCVQNSTPSYKIHFDSASIDASGTMAFQFFNTYGEITLNKNTFTRTGYSFTGWDLDDDGTVDYEDEGKFSDPFNGAKTAVELKAVWEAGYIITFDANGGTGTMEQQTIAGPPYTAPLKENQFVRDGYYFAGWSTERDNPSIVANDQEEYTPTKETTLYAQWRQ